MSVHDAVGVGQDEQPLTWVWGAHCASCDSAGAGSVSEPNEVAENIGESAGPQTGHVFDDDPAGAERGQDGDHEGPEPAGV